MDNSRYETTPTIRAPCGHRNHDWTRETSLNLLVCRRCKKWRCNYVGNDTGGERCEKAALPGHTMCASHRSAGRRLRPGERRVG